MSPLSIALFKTQGENRQHRWDAKAPSRDAAIKEKIIGLLLSNRKLILNETFSNEEASNLRKAIAKFNWSTQKIILCGYMEKKNVFSTLPLDLIKLVCYYVTLSTDTLKKKSYDSSVDNYLDMNLSPTMGSDSSLDSA